MNPKKKPFAIYRNNQRADKPELWEKYRCYHTIDDATQALLDLTKRPKKTRVFLYIILPNESKQYKWHIFKDYENLMKIAR